MSSLVGGSAALVALAAGILGHVDPLTSLWRAALVFVLGWIGGSVWTAITNPDRGTIEESEMVETPPGEVGAT
ncbi:MAG TPA: hypothetical protein VHE55_05405 [Fimbriimonadaceae bacterium]|nr:hypothetical protein [Fimbriimonadaceae bacterium]